MAGNEDSGGTSKGVVGRGSASVTGVLGLVPTAELIFCVTVSLVSGVPHFFLGLHPWVQCQGQGLPSLAPCSDVQYACLRHAGAKISLRH